jgi:hypothetical protein
MHSLINIITNALKIYKDSYFGGDSLNISLQNSIMQQIFYHNILKIFLQLTNEDSLRIF